MGKIVFLGTFVFLSFLRGIFEQKKRSALMANAESTNWCSDITRRQGSGDTISRRGSCHSLRKKVAGLGEEVSLPWKLLLSHKKKNKIHGGSIKDVAASV